MELILQDYSLCQQPPSLLAVVTLEVADEVSSHNIILLVIGSSPEIARKKNGVERCIDVWIPAVNFLYHTLSLPSSSFLFCLNQVLSTCTRLGSLYAGGYSSSVVDDCLMDLRMLSNGIMSNCDIDDICSRYACLHDCEDY